MSRATQDDTLRSRRDKAIVEKFIHLHELRRIRFVDVMYRLKWEYFFLKNSTIKKILRDNKVKLPYHTNYTHESPDGLTLNQTRNNKIIKRYDYYAEVLRKRHDDTLMILSRYEFYLKEKTIENILKSHEIIKPDNNDLFSG